MSVRDSSGTDVGRRQALPGTHAEAARGAGPRDAGGHGGDPGLVAHERSWRLGFAVVARVRLFKTPSIRVRVPCVRIKNRKGSVKEAGPPRSLSAGGATSLSRRGARWVSQTSPSTAPAWEKQQVRWGPGGPHGPQVPGVPPEWPCPKFMLL